MFWTFGSIKYNTVVIPFSNIHWELHLGILYQNFDVFSTSIPRVQYTGVLTVKKLVTSIGLSRKSGVWSPITVVS